MSNVAYVTPLIFAGIINIAISFYVLWQNPKSTLNRTFFILGLFISFWCLSSIMTLTSKSPSEALLWERFMGIGYISLTGIYLHFILSFYLQNKPPLPRISYLFIYIPAVTLLTLLLSTNLIIAGSIQTRWGYVGIFGSYYYLFLIYLVLCFALGLYMLSRIYFKSESFQRKKQAQLIIAATIFPLGISMFINTLLPLNGIYIYRLGAVSTSFTAAIIAYAIHKYRLMSISSSTAATIAADSILATMADGLFVLNLNMQIVIANPFILNMLNYKKSDLHNRQITELVSEGNTFFDEVIWSKLMNKETVKNYELTFLSKDNTMIPVMFSASSIINQNSQISGIVCTVRDMREIHSLIEELRKATLLLDEKVKERTRDLERAKSNLEKSYLHTLEVLALAIDAKDPYTLRHSENVTRYSSIIAKELKFDDNKMEELRNACRMHDIGKIAVPDSILGKQSKLSEVEWDVIKKHSKKGAEILEPMPFLRGAVEIVRHHHERFDGKGYPDGYNGDAISLGARIIAVADAFDAMMSDRPYRKAFSIQDAVSELQANSGTQFDPEIVEIFIKILDKNPDFIK